MLKIVSVSASVAALALLAACGSRQPTPQVVVIPPPTPPAPVVTNQPQSSPQAAAPAPSPQAAPAPANVAGVPKARPGFGRVETVTAMPTASAGGTAPAMMQRLSIKMEDGTMQFVDTSVTGIVPGDRVEITTEGYLKR
jgi:hypothetical protein